MRAKFRWNSWNSTHIAKHGVTESEAEYVVRHAESPFPLPTRDQKWLVRGRTRDGRLLQVIYVIDADENFDYESMTLADILDLIEEGIPRFYVVHAREMTPREKSNYRQRR